MEVAGQWRREWAGTAEYGKIIEGGVTHRVARAMEVLNASAPGARVRVMRAAYHSSAGPGAPTASYLMHSSRQVLSSGYNFLEPSPLLTKPLEISSTPLDSSPDSETENYKVTEPDDFDISEPSKWKASTGKSSIRMPSEESSSTDNASIIDLDSRSSSRNNIRRSFNGKHDINRINGNSRVSPLLDAPTALSTLKYTSLLSASDDWNNRRKSYSFEDTSPLNKSITPEVNLSIESSTDSGICKSSEIFQDANNSMYLKNKEKDENNSEFTFKDWLSKNRDNSYKEIKISHPKIVHVESKTNNITLQSTGKMSITLPIDTYSGHHLDVQSRSSDDNDRRTKKVEFCKTELHFAADTGTVNIIATDEKPPPSNDFRRRRSAFVPLNEKMSDRSITLFGDKSDISEIDTNFGISNYNLVDTDENTAATKSILKNKIPKPKPYLLGENMVFGTSNNDTNDDFGKSATVTSAVSLINRQLHSERRYSNDTISSITSEVDSSPLINIQARKIIKDPQIRGSSSQRHNTSQIESSFKYSSKRTNPKPSSVSPTPSRSKIRELRGSELAYFGIPNDENLTFTHSEDNLQEEILHSVKLVQQISNSVCNSEAESDDGPEYQNIPTNLNFKMQPTPKPRTKYSDHSNKMTEKIILHAITEQDTDIEVPSQLNRKTINNFGDPLSVSRKHNEHTTRQVKVNLQNHVRKTSMDDTSLPRRKENSSSKKVKQVREKEQLKTSRKTSGTEIKKSESPLYVNLDLKNNSGATTKNSCRDLSYKHKGEKTTHTESRINDKEHVSSLKRNDRFDKNKENRYSENGEKHDIKRDHQSPLVKKRAQKRTEKLCTPDNLPVYSVRQHSLNDNKVASKKKDDDKYKNINNELLNKTAVQNTPIKITAISTSIDKHKKESVHNLSNKDTLIIPKASDSQHSRHSDGTLSDKKSTSKSTRNTLNSQQSLKSNQNKIIITKLDKPVKPHRSKYVINYDDKNGTVSSVCKIKSGPVTYKRKMISIDNKDHKEPNKGLNKIALLNLPDRQWISNKQQYKNKWKSSQAQRSCQLL